MFIHMSVTDMTSVTDMQQLPAAKGHVRIQMPALAYQQGTVQCTIYDAQQMPVRMVPLEAGHEHGVYTLRLASLPSGKYTVQVKGQALNVQLDQ